MDIWTDDRGILSSLGHTIDRGKTGQEKHLGRSVDCKDPLMRKCNRDGRGAALLNLIHRALTIPCVADAF